MLNNKLNSPEIIPLYPKSDKTIIIPAEEYKELLIIKGRYEELTKQNEIRMPKQPLQRKSDKNE